METSLEARDRPADGRARWALAGLWLCAWALFGCSWLLDPDALTAERLGPTDVDAAEVASAEDAADGATGDTTRVGDAHAPVDDAHAVLEDADARVDDADARVDDADAAADGDAGDTNLDTNTDSDAIDGDAAIAREVLIARPGVGGCELDYKSIIITGCPQTCPQAAGWTLVFDASGSVGVESFHWEFAVTNNYGISPEVATTARVEVTVEVPSCILFGATMGSAQIIARLRVDGELTEYPADVAFSVRNVTGCGATQGNCASPP